MTPDTSAGTAGDAPFGSLVTVGLEQTSTVDRVVEELRRAVFEGELESGTPLREVALAESLGVSRPTVREALTVLVADGLATREPHRGVAVATPDPESIGDVSRARGVLELAGVQHWSTADEVDREAVRTALKEYGAAVGRDATYEELNRRHLAIHLSLVGLTGSQRLVAMAEQLTAELRLALAQVDRVRRNASRPGRLPPAPARPARDGRRRRGRGRARAPPCRRRERHPRTPGARTRPVAGQ